MIKLNIEITSDHPHVPDVEALAMLHHAFEELSYLIDHGMLKLPISEGGEMGWGSWRVQMHESSARKEQLIVPPGYVSPASALVIPPADRSELNCIRAGDDVIVIFPPRPHEGVDRDE